MEKARPLLRWAGILLVCVSISFFRIEAQGSQEPAKTPQAGRPDLIKIDTLAAYQKLELPAVTFQHDKHTDALLKEKKNCETCHFVENGKLSFSYKRKEGTKPAELKDLYHSSCIGCHNETAAAGKKSGPPDGFCRSCHNAEPPAGARLQAGLNKVSHYRHIGSKALPAPSGQKDNCGACHHSYDLKTRKVSYIAGKEDNCHTCHGTKSQNGVKGLEQAAHQQCVLCHLDLAGKGVKENGPYVCAGCHSARGQALVAKNDQAAVAKLPNREVPRLMRGQPDAALITYVPSRVEKNKGAKPILMSPVAFDHQAHEKYNDSCKVCHHAGMKSCGTCHTLSGSKMGNFVPFEQAMHSQTSQQSCIGCHNARQAAASCAGCHKHMDKTCRPEDANCRQCHIQPPQGFGALTANLSAGGPQQSAAAEAMLKGRNMNPGTYAEGDIPDKVVIKDLCDKYEPVEMNHRRHVQAILKGMQGDKLAAYFHRDPGTICQGCHHNSPADKEPPHCSNCHPTHMGAKESNRPVLLAALHGQCMSCHKEMRVEKPAATACIECHQEKQK